MKNILFSIACLIVISACSGCVSRDLERRPPGKPKQAVRRHDTGRDAQESDDPLFDLVFRKSRREQRARQINSDLFSPSEKAIINRERGKHWQATDDKDWHEYKKNHQFKSKENSTSDWVFGF